MLGLILSKHDSTWNRFYDQNINFTEYNTSQYIAISENIYVNNVIFKNMSLNGAIRVYDDNYGTSYKVLISESFFYNSYSNSSGGSIYIYTDDNTQYRICSINSTIGNTDESYGCHSYSNCLSNHFIENSIAQCKGYSSSIRLSAESQIIELLNISHANCERSAAYNSESIDHFQMNFTSIFNNSANLYSITDSTYDRHKMSHCLIIRNTIYDNSDLSAIISTGISFFEIRRSILVSNSGYYLFRQSHQVSYIVDQCYIANNNVKELAGGHEPEKMIINTTNSLDLYISLLSTKECINIYHRRTLPVQYPYQNHKHSHIWKIIE